MHRKEPFQHRERNGEKDAAVGGSCGEFFPEDEHSDDEQNHACDKVKVTCRNESGFSDKNGKTGNSAKSEIIRKFKKYVPNAIRSVLNVSIKKCFNLFILFSPKYEIKTLLEL